jgi:hypothetical protein
MITTRKTTKAVTAARDKVLAERARLEEWQRAKATAEAELTTLQGRLGDLVLDDPAAAELALRQQQQLRDRVDVAERAIVAQGPRVATAETAYLTAEADALEPAIAAAEADLAKHRARTQELLAQLETHEARFVPEIELTHAQMMLTAPGEGRVAQVSIPRSHDMAWAIEEMRRPVHVLREMAAGREPASDWVAREWETTPAKAFPACVYGPDAVVPSQAYLRERATVEGRTGELQTRVAELDALIESKSAKLADQRRQPWPVDDGARKAMLREFELEEKRIAALQSRRDEAHAELTSTTARRAELTA